MVVASHKSFSCTAPDGQLTVGSWAVDVRGHCVTSGQTTRRLEPKVMELLVCLASRPGQVVSREELDEQVWGGVTVGYDSLTGAIGKLRKALDDDSASPDVVETIPKVGYRLIADVETGLQTGAASPQAAVPAPPRGHGTPPRRVWALAGAVAAVLLVVAGVTMLGRWAQDDQMTPDGVAPVLHAQLPLPAEPSIAVLPFDNLSGDASQDYFADGITENIIGTLASAPRLFVIARNSTFTYKAKPVNVRDVAKDLGVRYVLEGSVYKAGERLRITAQLIDALSGDHLWSGRYDREAKDIFALQDEITLNVATELQVELTEGEQARMISRGTDNLEAWTYLWRSVEFIERYTKEDNARARALIEKAVELAPDYAEALVFLAWRHYQDARWEWSALPARSLDEAKALAQKALDLDDGLADTYVFLATIAVLEGRYDQAITLGRKAVALEPNNSDAAATFASVLLHSGRPEDAVTYIRQAMRLSPHYPVWYLNLLADAQRMMRRYAEAVAYAKGAVGRSPDFHHAHVLLASIYAELGRDQDARAAAAEVLRIDPDFSIEDYMKGLRYRDAAQKQRFRDGMHKAGLPD
ncbi:MAG: winged helix-turn-helix domain-containing tetratricopeptide repeat protein [Hyphomicrobiales bacterium]